MDFIPDCIYKLPTLLPQSRILMKSLLIASLFIISSSVMAMPNVGDVAILAGSADGLQIEIKSELVASSADRSSFTRLNTTMIDNSKSEEVETISKEDLVSEETIQTLLMMCESEMLNGKLETITVPAGTFETCKIEAEGSSINLGLVPFGVVRVSNATASFELQSYKIAK